MPAFIVNLNYPTQLFRARSKRLNHQDHPVKVARVGSLESIIMFLESQTRQQRLTWATSAILFIIETRPPLLRLALHNFESKGVKVHVMTNTSYNPSLGIWHYFHSNSSAVFFDYQTPIIIDSHDQLIVDLMRSEKNHVCK